jgi:hypothetical protein
MQMAEILNNLGCLAYMCGQPAAANIFFRESMDVQFNLMGQSLYLCSAAVGQSISLNLSITRANIGFVKLVTGENPVAVTALENALMVCSLSCICFLLYRSCLGLFPYCSSLVGATTSFNGCECVTPCYYGPLGCR